MTTPLPLLRRGLVAVSLALGVVAAGCADPPAAPAAESQAGAPSPAGAPADERADGPPGHVLPDTSELPSATAPSD
ncbi:MAG TPA: hypothetical protein VIK91_23955, partial [Nannocystis sp.]